MKGVVVYDSKFGNTEVIARAIAETLSGGEPVLVVVASTASERDLAAIDLLAVGGPTQGHGLSPDLRALLDRLPMEAVRDVLTVTFDTQLTRKGARLLAPPESFLVTGTEGPLVEGELERARAWAKDVRTAAGLPEREPASTAMMN